jgi:hypothetical protein
MQARLEAVVRINIRRGRDIGHKEIPAVGTARVHHDDQGFPWVAADV